MLYPVYNKTVFLKECFRWQGSVMISFLALMYGCFVSLYAVAFRDDVKGFLSSLYVFDSKLR